MTNDRVAPSYVYTMQREINDLEDQVKKLKAVHKEHISARPCWMCNTPTFQLAEYRI